MSTNFSQQCENLYGYLDNDFYFIEGLGLINWNGCYWKMCSVNILELRILEWCGNNYQSPSELKKYLEMYRMTHTKTIEQIDVNRDRIAFSNGTFYINNYIFAADCFYKEDYSTKGFEFPYDESATTKVFDKYLKNVMNNDVALISLIQEMMGYCLMDSCKYEKAFLLFGEGGTGKSVLLKTISTIWGSENCSNVPFDRINEPFMRAGMYGKKINFSSELENDIHNTAYFKAMVSGEEIDAQFKFKDSFKFHNTSKMVFAMNNLPVIKDKTTGTFRRLIIIPFEKNFSETKERDVNLIDKILKEKSGIMMFAIQGLKRLVANQGFTKSEKSEKYIKDYKDNNDTIKIYIDETCVYDDSNDKNRIAADDLYSSYSSWCSSSGYKAMNKINFLKNVVRIYPKCEKKKMRLEGELKYGIPFISLIDGMKETF